jgi:hypothetical protein
MSERPFPDQEAASFISKHSVALLLPDQYGPGGVRLVGSGSLVTFDRRYFILTATHVWTELRKSSLIHYSAIGEIAHTISLFKEALTTYSLDDNLEEELRSGKKLKEFDADLTLLELHPVDYRKMDTRLSFFALDRKQQGEINGCVIIGSPGVLAKRDPRGINSLSFELRAIFVETLMDEAERDGLDFLKSLPYQDPSSPIQDYRGMSGGGLWSVSYYRDKLADDRYEIFLIGVIFWQTHNEVRCLGRKAIKQLIQKIRQIT